MYIDDRYLYKNPTPPVTMGLSSRVEYKNFDLGMSFRANLGNYVFNDVLRGSSNVGETGGWVQQAYMANHLRDAMDRNWQTWELTANQSDYYVQNASFLKCDNITLGRVSILKSATVSIRTCTRVLSRLSLV